MGDAMPQVSLVLPTYNAAPLLARIWPEVLEALRRKAGAWEALFVCDGCSDGSDQTLEQLAAESEGLVRVIRYSRNRGKGYAVRLGLQRARGEYRIFTDVDLAYPLEMIEAVAEQLASGLDVVIASRLHRESEVIAAPGLQRYLRWRKVQSFVFSTLARLLVGVRQHDPQAGLKGLSRRAVELMISHVRCTGFGFDCDLLAACRYFGIPVREMAVRVIYDGTHSTTRLTSGFRMVRELWRIRRRWQAIRRNGLPEPALPVPGGAVQPSRREEAEDCGTAPAPPGDLEPR